MSGPSTVIAGTGAITPEGLRGRVEVVVDDGTITAVRSTSRPAPDRLLVPGFVDLQVNGQHDVDVATAEGGDWDRLDAALGAAGVTTWCPTLVTAPLDAYAAPLARIAEAAARSGARPRIAGVHLEGPFLGALAGAHPPDLVAPIDVQWLEALPSVVRVVTLGPEVPGALAAIRLLVERGVLVSLGHSAADHDQSVAAVDAGARLATHAFNAMGPLHHRAPGLVGVALSDDRLAVSLIADLAHVHAAVLRLTFRAKGPTGVVLVTDAVAWRAGRVGAIAVAPDADGVPRLLDGTIAGSALTMDGAVRNVVRAARVDLADAVAAAATNPARLLGLGDRGRLAPGLRADVVALTSDLEVAGTWIGGQRVH